MGRFQHSFPDSQNKIAYAASLGKKVRYLED
jgi:hypothetical protein